MGYVDDHYIFALNDFDKFVKICHCFTKFHNFIQLVAVFEPLTMNPITLDERGCQLMERKDWRQEDLVKTIIEAPGRQEPWKLPKHSVSVHIDDSDEIWMKGCT